MRKIFFLIIVILSFSSKVNSQTSDALNQVIISSDTAQLMQGIEKVCNSIMANKEIFLKLVIFKDSLSFRNVYLKDNVLQMVEVQFKENKIEKNVNWYFSNAELIYAEAIWIGMEKRDTISDTKCYFSFSHMIAWINEENKIVDPASKAFKDREIQMVEYSKRLWVNAMDQK